MEEWKILVEKLKVVFQERYPKAKVFDATFIDDWYHRGPFNRIKFTYGDVPREEKPLQLLKAFEEMLVRKNYQMTIRRIEFRWYLDVNGYDDLWIYYE
jgi:hypothetical protein